MNSFATDDQAIAAWLFGQSENTREAYERDIRQFRKFCHMPLAAIRLGDLQAYQKRLGQTLHRGQPLKPATINRKIIALKSLFSFCFKLEYLGRNPTIALKPAKIHRKIATKILTREEIESLFGGATRPRDETFLRFLFYTSARVSEAVGVSWQDFVIQPSGQVQVELLGKRDKQRSVLVPEDLWQRLNQLREQERPFPFSRRAGDMIIKDAAQRAQLGKVVSCHWLRHSHATHALRKGAPVSLVRDTLGHSSISSTNIYLESFPGESSSTYL